VSVVGKSYIIRSITQSHLGHHIANTGSYANEYSKVPKVARKPAAGTLIVVLAAGTLIVVKWETAALPAVMKLESRINKHRAII
jgi:hypothetical protein